MQTDIIRMAREECPYTSDEMRGAFYEGFLKGSAAEREACAKVCEQPQTWVCPDSAEHLYEKPGHCEDCGKTLVQIK